MKLPELKHVWDMDPEGVIGLQMLKEMRVEDCEHLESLFPASVAKDLTRLQVLEVTRCEELAEIFRKDEEGEEGEEGEGTTQESLFPHLTTLTLHHLPRLECSIHCSKEQVSSTNLSLIYSPLQELLRFRSWPIPNSSFGLLYSLTVDGCHFSSDILLPFNLLSFLNNLQTLELRNCNSVKTIFYVKCTTQNTTTIPLKKLLLSELPNLENVWNEDPCRILSMHHLQEVQVEKCKDLTSVFPASIAKNIVKPENLVVKDCERLMSIVTENNTDPNGTNQKLPCPRVRSLLIRGLPRFKYFYYCSLQCDSFTSLESRIQNQV